LDQADRIERVFGRAGLPTTLKLSPSQKAALFQAMSLDKKVSAGSVRFVLAKRIGQVEFGHNVPQHILSTTLDALRFESEGPKIKVSGPRSRGVGRKPSKRRSVPRTIPYHPADSARNSYLSNGSGE
jgi:hypothetical protein